MHKSEVRAKAAALRLRTAGKADSQDVCFITSGRGSDGSGGRSGFLGERMSLHPGRLVDPGGQVVGSVPAVELVTVGQRRGLGAGEGGARRYALSVEVASGTVTVGTEADLLVDGVSLGSLSWVDEPVRPGATILAQTSAHGTAREAVFEGHSLRWAQPARRVAPGQTVALYDGDRLLGGALSQ
jgi:tRNA-specific 2-thiouridylase